MYPAKSKLLLMVFTNRYRQKKSITRLVTANQVPDNVDLLSITATCGNSSCTWSRNLINLMITHCHSLRPSVFHTHHTGELSGDVVSSLWWWH